MNNTREKGKPFTIYLAGQMSGLDGYGFDRFAEATQVLRDIGVVVLSPAETAGGVAHLPRDWYFRFDFAVIGVCDAVVVLPSWTKSQGAQAEVVHAVEIGVPIYEFHMTRGLGRMIHVTDWTVNHRKGLWAKIDALGIIPVPEGETEGDDEEV
jgi:hypothetical protein